jgi:hypothetical protein
MTYNFWLYQLRFRDSYQSNFKILYTLKIHTLERNQNILRIHEFLHNLTSLWEIYVPSKMTKVYFSTV